MRLKSLRDQSRLATKKQVGILRDKSRKVTALKSKPVRVYSHNVFQSESTIREQLSMRDVFAERSALWSPVPATERETSTPEHTRRISSLETAVECKLISDMVFQSCKFLSPAFSKELV